jgi:hypothetical protein
MEGIAVVVIGIFLFAVVGMRITRYLGVEKWHVSLGLIALAILLHFVNVLLIWYFIKKKTPDFASTEEVFPGIHKWELTAGTGIVPKWVSVIGLLAISAFATALLPWIMLLLKMVMSVK